MCALVFFPAGYLSRVEETTRLGTESPAEMQQLWRSSEHSDCVGAAGSTDMGSQRQVAPRDSSPSLRGWLRNRKRSFAIACLCTFVCAFCVAQATLRAVASAPQETPASERVQRRLSAVAPEEPSSSEPVVDGHTALSAVPSVPSWCRSFFTRFFYDRMPLGGVIDPEKIRTGNTPWKPREGRRTVGGRPAPVQEGGEARLSRVVSASTVASEEETCGKEEGYRHLLHEILTEHGDITDFQYFVSDDDRQRSGEQTEHPHMLVLCRIGRKTCAHKGVVHGGFTAALLDNSVSYLAHLIFSRAATKSLTVKYFRPLLAEAFTLVDVEIESVDREAGTAVVVGTVYTEIPEKLKKHKLAGDKQKKRAGKNLPEGVWPVAVGKAVMVDVTNKWTEFR